MWTFRKHRHLKLETLSEYLDGRLHSAAREKVARGLESCASCREELESLRATALLLQDLPEVQVPRAFTLAGPPPERVTEQPSVHLRMPNWAYAGAASLAGLALAVLVSADATGLLTPGPATVSPGASSAATPAQEHAAATAAPDALAAAAPTETPVPKPQVAAPEPESIQSFRAMQESEGDGGAEKSPAPSSGEPSATPAPEQETMATLQMAPTPGQEPSEADSPRGPQGPEASSATDQEPPPPTEDRASEQAPVAEPEALPQRDAGQEQGTPLVWRVLEGVAAALALAFLAGLVFRWRQSRRVAGN
jgi:anti-sigma factor RsiW